MSENINKKLNKGFSEIGKGVIAITMLVCSAIVLGEISSDDLQEVNAQAQMIDLTSQEIELEKPQINLEDLQKQIDDLEKELEQEKEVKKK